jgi:hypothetical protein
MKLSGNGYLVIPLNNYKLYPAKIQQEDEKRYLLVNILAYRSVAKR